MVVLAQLLLFSSSIQKKTFFFDFIDLNDLVLYKKAPRSSGVVVMRDDQLARSLCVSLLLIVFGKDDAPERRCSSRTFRYGYLVTT